MTFEKRVYAHEFKLNDTDDSIVEYIRANRKNLVQISIHKIAGELFISPNAIMRMAKKLGYSGFSELKYSLQKEDNPGDTITAQQQVFSKMPQNIIKSLDVMEESVLKELVSHMLAADKILFAGIGDSVYFCELFGRYLRCLNKKTEYYQQIHDVEYGARQCEPGDFILIISASGETKRLVDLALDARERGIDVYCITHFGDNSLSRACKGQLCFWGEPRIVNGYNVTDRSGLMMVVRLVCEEFWKCSIL